METDQPLNGLGRRGKTSSSRGIQGRPDTGGGGGGGGGVTKNGALSGIVRKVVGSSKTHGVLLERGKR